MIGGFDVFLAFNLITIVHVYHFVQRFWLNASMVEISHLDDKIWKCYVPNLLVETCIIQKWCGLYKINDINNNLVNMHDPMAISNMCVHASQVMKE